MSERTTQTAPASTLAPHSERAALAEAQMGVPAYAEADDQQPPAEGLQPEPASDGAADAAAKAAEAARQAEEREAEARKECHATLTALVRAYRQGEKAYRQGLLEAGRLSVEYIARRLALGDKRAAAVQAIEGQLAVYATDTVDVARLVRCWSAYDLLAVGQGLHQAPEGRKQAPADAVPYGADRDAWALLLLRQAKDTPAETFALLPGLEDKCRAAFKHAVAEGLSKAACVEQCQALVREHGRLDQERTRAEAEAKAAAEKAARERADAEARAREAAEAERKAAERAARDAEERAKGERDAEAKAARQAEAEAARKALEERRRQEDAARFQAEQAARDASRAKREAEEAARRQAEAEAARARQEQKARDKEQRAAERKAGGKAPEQQPAPEARQGQNLLASARKATAKDAADMLRAVVQGHDDPQAVLFDAVAGLLASPVPGLTADDVVRTVFLALDKARLPGQAGEAVKAARLVLNRKAPAKESKPGQQPAAEPPATVKALEQQPANEPAAQTVAA
jgi:hypothetical protein